MFNKLILNRFFFRKNQDSSTDFYLPLLFMAVVCLSTILIFISSLQLFDLNKKKQIFLSNKWNKMYDLFAGSSKFIENGKYKGNYHRGKYFYEFEDYIDSIHKSNNDSTLFKFYKGDI